MSKEQEMKMLEKLEEARKASEDGCTYYAMTNGEKIGWTGYPDTKQHLEDNGYWVCSIFQNGHRVEA